MNTDKNKWTLASSNDYLKSEMKLKYRGISYEYEPITLETVPTKEVTGKYRGANWFLKILQKAPITMPVKGLKYRGVSYDKAGNLPKQTPDTNSET